MPTPTPTVKLYGLMVSISPPAAGSVMPRTGYFAPGSTIILTATASSGYAFDHWGGDVSGTSAAVTVSINSDKNITVFFSPVVSQAEPKLSVAEAKRILDTDDKAVFVDVRSAADFEKSHIPRALSIPMQELADRYKEIPQGTKVVVYASCT